MPRQFDPPKIAKVLALVLGGAAAGERASARATLERILHAQGIAGAICCRATTSTGSTMRRASASIIDCIRYGLAPTMRSVSSTASSSSSG